MAAYNPNTSPHCIPIKPLPNQPALIWELQWVEIHADSLRNIAPEVDIGKSERVGGA